jgi:hypothetical protein
VLLPFPELCFQGLALDCDESEGVVAPSVSKSGLPGRRTQLGGTPGNVQAQRRAGLRETAHRARFCAFLRAGHILIGMADQVPGGGGPLAVPRPQSPEDRLDSWKQIATYLDRSIRTVQQWERTEKLPVHRLRHSKYGSVYAFRSELDNWRVQRTAVAEVPGTPVPKPGSEIQPATQEMLLADRYQSARDAGVDLRRVMRQKTEEPAKFARKRTKVGSGAVLIAVALAAGIPGLLRRFDRSVMPARLEYTPLTNFADSATSPALSPDGRTLAFIRSEYTFGGPGQIYIKRLPDGDPVQLTNDYLGARGGALSSRRTGSSFHMPRSTPARGGILGLYLHLGASLASFWPMLPGLPGSKSDPSSPCSCFPSSPVGATRWLS